MRLLKFYLANDREGHFVTASEAMSAPGQVWSCASCGCCLVLHAGTFSDPVWFEHDTTVVVKKARRSAKRPQFISYWINPGS